MVETFKNFNFSILINILQIYISNLANFKYNKKDTCIKRH